MLTLEQLRTFQGRTWKGHTESRVRAKYSAQLESDRRSRILDTSVRRDFAFERLDRTADRTLLRAE